MHLLNFLIATILFILAGNIWISYLFKMMQPDGAFDVMFGWQKKLDRWYSKSANPFYRWLHDAAGGCQQCTAFWFMPIWFGCYFLMMRLPPFDYWITDTLDSMVWKCVISFIWFGLFWSIGAFGGVFFINRKLKKDGV